LRGNQDLVQDPNLTVPAIASQDPTHHQLSFTLLRLSSLAPDIVTAIINGNTRLSSARTG
jgi:hypothetical protein